MIYSERIRLRTMERGDLPKFVEWVNDPEVHTGIGRYLSLLQIEEENWVENMLQRPPHEYTLAIEINTPNDGW